MGKIIGGIAAAVVIIIAIAATVLYFNLDKIIIAGVEGYGSDVTKGDVTSFMGKHTNNLFKRFSLCN